MILLYTLCMAAFATAQNSAYNIVLLLLGVKYNYLTLNPVLLTKGVNSKANISTIIRLSDNISMLKHNELVDGY